MARKHPAAVQSGQAQAGAAPKAVDAGTGTQGKQPTSLGGALFVLLLIAAAAPFLSLGSGISGLISLFIIFIGLRQAWSLTARSELLVMGPYDTAPVQ